jgi:hypothetical protein
MHRYLLQSYEKFSFNKADMEDYNHKDTTKSSIFWDMLLGRLVLHARR